MARLSAADPETVVARARGHGRLRRRPVRLEDRVGRPRPRPLVRGQRGVRAKALKLGEDEVADDIEAAGRDRDGAGRLLRLRRPGRRSTTPSGRATHENVGGEAHRRHPDAVRAHPARPDRRPAGRHRRSRTSSSTSSSTPRAKNPYHFPPRWLNEGLAVYQSEGYGADDRGRRSRTRARDGHLIPLDGLTGQFPNGQRLLPRLRGERRRRSTTWSGRTAATRSSS